MKVRMKLAALAMAGATAALVLTAAPALASSKAITGPEIAYGAVYGKAATANNPVIPVVWRGVVRAHGVFSTNGPPPTKGQHHTFVTSAGNLRVVVTAPPTSSQSFNTKACRFSFTTYVVFKVVDGTSTGKFRWTQGPRGEGLRRRGRAEVQVRPAQGPVQHQPERARAGEGRGRVLPVERRAQEGLTVI
jgi:hypothetical protein